MMAAQRSDRASPAMGPCFKFEEKPLKKEIREEGFREIAQFRGNPPPSSRDGGGAERGWAAANSLKQCRRRGIDAEACYGLCSQLPRDPCRARALTRHATSEWCVSTRAGSRTHPAAPRGCWSPKADAARGHHELTDPGGAGAHAVCGGDIACVWQRLGRVRHSLC